MPAGRTSLILRFCCCGYIVVLVVAVAGLRTAATAVPLGAFVPGRPGNSREAAAAARTHVVRRFGSQPTPLGGDHPGTETGRNDNCNSINHNNQLLDEYLAAANLGQAARLLKEAAAAHHPNDQNQPLVQLTRERFRNIFAAIEERTAALAEDEPTQTTTNQGNTDGGSSSASTKNGAVQFPAESVARAEMTDLYRTLHQQDQLVLFGAASNNNSPTRAAVTTCLPTAGSHAVSPALLEQILNLKMTALTPQPTNTLVLAGAAVAVLEGMISATTGIPINALFVSTLGAAFFDRLFINGAISESFFKLFNPAVQAKIVRHEAGHFLLAYLLGCPVEGIVLTAWAALQDRRFGRRQVSAGTSFFDPELSYQINTLQQLTRSSIDRYSIIVMAGIAAEADFYGRADGGAGDEMALVAFLSKLNNRNNGSGKGNNSNNAAGTVWDSEAIRNQARWGALNAVLLLREYKAAYEALVDALERGGRLGDCIYAIEKAARDHNLKPLQQPLGYLVDAGNGQPASWQTTTDNTTAATTTTTSATPPQQAAPWAQEKVWNEQESLAVLQEYRTTTERRLEQLNRQLLKDRSLE
jgi:hypothetical protein